MCAGNRNVLRNTRLSWEAKAHRFLLIRLLLMLSQQHQFSEIMNKRIAEPHLVEHNAENRRYARDFFWHWVRQLTHITECSKRLNRKISIKSKPCYIWFHFNSMCRLHKRGVLISPFITLSPITIMCWNELNWKFFWTMEKWIDFCHLVKCHCHDSYARQSKNQVQTF